MIAVARRTSPACHRLGTNNQVGSGVRRALGSDIGSSPNAKAQRTGSPRFKLSFPQLRGCGAFQLPQYPWVPQSVGNSSAVGHHRPGSVPPDAEGEPARAANSPTSRRPWASAAPSRRPPPSAPAKVPAAGRAGRAVSLRRGRGFPDCHYITVFSRSGGSGDRAARQDLARSVRHTEASSARLGALVDVTASCDRRHAPALRPRRVTRPDWPTGAGGDPLPNPPLDSEYDRLPHSGLRGCATPRLKEAISWPLKPGPVRD